MGNSLGIFCSWFRRRFRPCHRQLARLVCEGFPAGWAHPTAPAPVPAPGILGCSRFLFNPQQYPGPSFPARWDGAPTRLCLLPRNWGTPLRVPPPVDWSPPSRKKPVLSAHNSMMFGHPSPMRIPRLRRKSDLQLPSLDKWVIPARLPKTEEEPEEPTEVDQVETQEDNKRGPCSNGEAASTSRPLETQGNLTSCWCSPRPLEGNVHLKSVTKKNQNEKAQVHAVSFYPKGHGVTSSHSPAGGILPFGKPDPAPTVLPAPVPTVFPAPVPTVLPAPVPTVLPAPVPGCSLWPKKAALKMLGKDHLPSSPALLMRGKDMQHKDPPALGSSSSSPPRAAGHESRKRKQSGSPLPLQPTPPLQLRWDRDELPPTAKLPCLSPEALLDLGQASQREGRLQQGNMGKNMRVLSRTSKSRRRKQPLGRRKKTWQGRRGGSRL
ncbi:putative UPF0607 protein ENSP00000382826 isoform X2 [Rhinopithecus roxellana]|uniref:putative UPF0607 protein ENSP00000382826 isoform X2 n=1 Tax=Rhinopithecus roxellana TaxID=61622 RepID=UPI0012378B62|nr:putative UPF0607 protein ENSP00000382826 isoform X2 [Rhinopithecus roxellana]